MKQFVALLAAYCISNNLFAQESRLILPDENFIEIECAALEENARRHIPKKVSSVEELCSDVRNKKISADEWMNEINPIAQEIDWSIPCP